VDLIRQTNVEEGITTFVESLEGRTLPAFTLPSIDGEETFTFPQGDKHYLFIPYTIADCALCFTEVPFWHELATTFADQLEVVGVVTGSTAEQGAYFAEHRGISIPLVYDEQGVLFDALDLKHSSLTPMKVLVNPQGGVLHLGRTTYNRLDAQAAYMEVVRSLLSSAGGSVIKQAAL